MSGMGWEYYLWWWRSTLTSISRGILDGDVSAWLALLFLLTPFFLVLGIRSMLQGPRRIEDACTRTIRIIDGQ